MKSKDGMKRNPEEVFEDLDRFVKSIEGFVENKVNSMLIKHLSVKWQIFSVIVSTLMF